MRSIPMLLCVAIIDLTSSFTVSYLWSKRLIICLPSKRQRCWSKGSSSSSSSAPSSCGSSIQSNSANALTATANTDTDEHIKSVTTSAVVGEKIGSGSYGTVHFLTLSDQDIQSSASLQVPSTAVKSLNTVFVGKRPWRYDELVEMSSDLAEGNDNRDSTPDNSSTSERSNRCLYYWQVERHCFAKLPPHLQLPPFFGTFQDWMVFGFVGQETANAMSSFPIPAPTLDDLMKEDIHNSSELTNIAKGLGVNSFRDVMDCIIPSLLSVLRHVHQNHIVHRDVKPSNLLVNKGTILLMDFGSAADLEPSSDRVSSNGRSNNIMDSLLQRQQRIGLDTDQGGNRVAVSPIYSAPEVFIDIHDAPYSFDIFSAALIVCQLLFGYLEERVDAGFHQQLQEGANCDLNVWLNNELGTKLRPAGLDHALEYLGGRPGLWTLLSDMLSIRPSDRPTAQQALRRWNKILEEKCSEDDESTILTSSRPECKDHPFFCMVLESLETCRIPSISKPLHYVATFSRSRSLGLVLSEKDEDEGNASTDDDESTQLWKEATKDALQGEVFIRKIVPGGQADELGILEVGDRLSGIGELPFIDSGFEKAFEMLQDQPRRSKFVRLHFDRLSVRENIAIPMVPTEKIAIKVIDYGAWSAKGKRIAQEDAFVLHEIHDAKDRSILLAGVMDGHGGTAAAKLVSTELPSTVANQLVVLNRERSVNEALEDSWITVCNKYRSSCSNDSCVADYDPMEGILLAETGSKDLTAGTTCSMFALDETTSELTMFNCGDSRCVVIGDDGRVVIATEQHKPQLEEKRLQEGIANGLDYSLPQCRLSRWWIKVGDYEYSVARSLEGPFATSKGIVSDPDVTTLVAHPGEVLVCATDGLWDVMDLNEVAMVLHKMRHQERMSARDSARALCALAIRKGSSDNVSAVVVYL